ncbi:MAG: putative peptide zinc metalloprotease protein [Actinomycetota bacterium]|nr:putative peptide zinc metalloprotease protein [Actinomycetota bacterium]
MKMTRKAMLVALTAALMLFGTPLGSGLAHAQGDTAAVAVNTKDDSSVFRLAFSIRRVMSGVVDQSNAAVAYASCESCRTVALSFQVVLVMSDPDVVTPENVALAINYECTSCETLASAYQYVLSTGGPVRFDQEAKAAIHDILKQLQDLKKNSDSMSIEEIAAQADALAEQLFTTIHDHLVEPEPSEDTTEETPTSTPTPQDTPTEEETPTPEETSSTPVEEETPTSEPTDETSSEPSPEPTSS